MIKRANKITALLVAATSVMSLVPAMAADSTRLGTKDGTIESAVAFNGKYIYEGYKGNDSKAVYFNDGSKDKELTDYEDYDFTAKGDEIAKYGEKYILAEDNNDEYLTDLTNGNILEDTVSDKEDSTASKLEKALSKTDKYDGVVVDRKDLHQIASSASYQNPWYYVTEINKDGKETRIFTDVNGKYIDSSVLANIYAYSTVRKEVVKVNKFDTDYTDSGLRVEIAKQPEVIGQDKDNLYAMVNVNIIDNTNKTTSAAVKASAEIDFSKAGIGNTNQVDVKAVEEKYIINTAQFSTTGQAITVNGHKYAYDASFGTAQLKSVLLNTPVSGYTRFVSGDVVTFTADKAEPRADIITESVPAGTPVTGLITKTEGQSATYKDQVAKIKVGANTYTYDANAVEGHATTFASGVGSNTYKSLTDLKNKIIVDFSGATKTINGRQYDFNPVTFAFTVHNTGTVSTTAVETELGDVKNVSTGGNGSNVATGKVTNAWYLQQISKAQGDTDSEALMPKTVKSYQVDNKSLYDNGDANDAYGWLLKDNEVAKFVNVQVKNNSLFAYKLDDSDTVKVFKLDLKQIKENPVDKAVYGTSKLDGYVVKKDGDADTDFENTTGNSLAVDANGVLWALHDGKVTKFDGKDKTVVYTVDSGFDQLTVYDAKNMVIWNQDDDRYTTVSEGTKVTQDESAAVAPVVATGWVQDGANWVFNDVTGAKVTNKWANVGGTWYFLNADGIMTTGWQQIGGTWYYFNPISDGTKGAMKTGWLNDNGTWYYLQGSGAMQTGWLNNNGTWYYFNPISDGTRGVMKTGWLNDNGTWYFLNASGAMLANTTVSGYRLNASGAWVK